MTKHIFIYVDESGTLPDPKGPIVVIAAVATYLNNQLILPKKSIKSKSGEVKFYNSGENTKKKYLGQKIPDTPENFAAICSLILHDCLSYYSDCLISIIFDRHFHRSSDREAFDEIIKKLISQNITISHVDSLKEPAVNTADMIAGSLLWKQTGMVNWKEAKKWFVKQKLARTGVNTHPNE